MTNQLSRRNRRRPKYNHCNSPTIAVIHSLAWQYHCVVIESTDITLKHKGRFVRIGTIDECKAMTIRGLIAFFEEITQDWRYEPINPVGHIISPIAKNNSGKLPELYEEYMQNTLRRIIEIDDKCIFLYGCLVSLCGTSVNLIMPHECATCNLITVAFAALLSYGSVAIGAKTNEPFVSIVEQFHCFRLSKCLESFVIQQIRRLS